MADHTYTITATTGSNGSLSGYRARCSCGFTAGDTWRPRLVKDMNAHAAYMAAKAKGPAALAHHIRSTR